MNHWWLNLAQSLQERLVLPTYPDIERVRSWIYRYTASRKIQLSEQQQYAVEMAAYSRITILTGGPCTGKTFCTRTIVELWKAMGKSIAPRCTNRTRCPKIE